MANGRYGAFPLFFVAVLASFSPSAFAAYSGPLPSTNASSGRMSPLQIDDFRDTGKFVGKSFGSRAGQLLQTALALMQQQKYEDAIAKLKEIDSLKDSKPEDLYNAERLRTSIALKTGNDAMLVQSAEKALASGLVPAEDKKNFDEVLARGYYQQKDFAKAASWAKRYFEEGGVQPYMQQLLATAAFLNNDYAAARDEAAKMIKAAEQGGEAPAEEVLRVYANSAKKLNDKTSYAAAIEKYAAYYPKPEHWSFLIDSLISKPGFPVRLEPDVYRLMQALDQLKSSSDYRNMADTLISAGQPLEAKKILDQGIETGVLGKDADAAKDRELLAKASRLASEDMAAMTKREPELVKGGKANELFDLGYLYVMDGKADKGLPLMEKAAESGKMKSPDEARLRLGEAYLAAGRKQEALKAFKAVQSSGPVGDIARYWSIYLAPSS